MKRTNNIFGIDLIKALAIIVIVIYHINANWLPGGFTGVDLFFVLSGYLLAGSLQRQIKRQEEINFFASIWKRLKQLWPVLFIVVFFTTIFITIFNQPILELAHRDIIPSLTFTNNWWFIINEVGYFESYFQSPFKHLWYVSVLMQSYIVIILVAKLAHNFSRKSGQKIFKIVLMILGLASFIAMQVFYDPLNVSRVYYGTDTRIFEIIIGVLAYYIYPLENLRKVSLTRQDLKEGKRDTVKRGRIFFISIISMTLFVLGTIYVNEVQSWVYRIGFLLFALNSALIVFTVGNENNVLFDKFRYIPFLRSLGLMSYSIYLWHFPVLVLTQSQEEVASGPNTTTTLFRLAFILILSILTYLYVEKPMKKERMARPKTRRERLEDRRREANTLPRKIMLGLSLIFILGVLGRGIPYLSTAFVDTPNMVDLPDELITGTDHLQAKAQEHGMEIIDGKATDEDQDPQEVQEAQAEEDKIKATLAQIPYDKKILIGDSLGINVGLTLKEIFPDMIVDAKVSRQLLNSEEVFAKYAEHDSPETALIVMLGTNGVFNESHLDDIFKYYPQSKKIIVNVKVPFSWQDQVNARFDSYIEKHPEIALVDWYSASKDNPEYFAGDNTHLEQAGVDAMIKLILEELKE